MATFADPQAVAAALKKTGSTANWLGDGTDTAPVDYAPVSYPQPPDKPPVQIPQDPDKLPPAAQVQAPKPTAPQPPPAIANDQPPAPAEPPPGEVTVTVKTPRQQAAQPAPVPDQQPSGSSIALNTPTLCSPSLLATATRDCAKWRASIKLPIKAPAPNLTKDYLKTLYKKLHS
jgi:outer membrane biosynthesis protein TonB